MQGLVEVASLAGLSQQKVYYCYNPAAVIVAMMFKCVAFSLGSQWPTIFYSIQLPCVGTQEFPATLQVPVPPVASL